MKKVEKLAAVIDQNLFIDYFSSHTRQNTAEYFNITELDVKSLAKFFNFKKSKVQIGQSVSNFYKNNTLVTLHLPGDTHFIRVNEDSLQDYLDIGYIFGYEQTAETKNNRINHSKQTKYQRYGDENYNNIEKNKSTKKERYGDENYNNKQQIKITQFEKYGCYGFNQKEKYENTMQLLYGCRHNWASDNPDLNGNTTKYQQYGGKDEYYQHVIEKGRKTKLELYGDEFCSNSNQAQITMLEKYNVPYFMLTEIFQEKSHSVETQKKRIDTKRANKSFTNSEPEKVVRKILEERFNLINVESQYCNPRYCSDITGYQYQCDFYIKPLDLFIELNYHPTHGLHPFDKNNKDDLKKLELLNSNPTDWNRAVIDVWTVRDVDKLKCAIKNNLNYIMLYPKDDYNNINSIIDDYLQKRGLYKACD